MIVPLTCVYSCVVGIKCFLGDMQCENNIFDVAVGLQSIIIIIKCADK